MLKVAEVEQLEPMWVWTVLVMPSEHLNQRSSVVCTTPERVVEQGATVAV